MKRTAYADIVSISDSSLSLIRFAGAWLLGGTQHTRLLRNSQPASRSTLEHSLSLFSAMSDHAKRTRSQLTLDEFGDIHLGVSPLKAARQEWRKSVPVASPLVHTPPNVQVNQCDDELLLSHHSDRPQKRTSPTPQELSSENDPERQLKRLKKDHDEGEGGSRHLNPEESCVAETTQPSGPFDFSAIGPKDLLSPTGSSQLGAAWTKRAQSVPLVSPSAPHRDLGQLMPSPRKTAPVSPVRDPFRFSSLPSTLEHLANDLVARNIGKSLTEFEREKEPPASHTLPPLNEMDTPSREQPTSEADTLRSCNDPSLAARRSLEVTTSNVSLVGPLLPLDVRPCIFRRVNNIHHCAVLSDDPERIAKGTRQ